MNQYHSSRVDKFAPVYRAEYSLIDSNGEIVREASYLKRPRNRKGFVLMYTAKMIEFLSKVRQGSVVRVFLYLAQKQGYGNDGVFGFRTSRKHLREFLGLDAKSVYSSLEYLKENFLVNEMMIDGSREYMVNPEYITIGSDRKAREREWSARWSFYWKHVNDKNKLKGRV